MNMNNHGMMMSPPPSSSSPSSLHNTTSMSHHGKMMMMHMSFYWGKNAEILFAGWPGTHTAMYILSLFVVFLLSFLVESISRTRFVMVGTNNDVVSGLLLTFLHTVRMGLAYLVMLAVMSFNGGIFLAVVAGHAFGFLLFGTRVFGSGSLGSENPDHITPYRNNRKTADLPQMSC